MPRVAVLASIVSPRYVKSDWCLRELREFWKASDASGGLRVGNKTRVFKIVKTPVPLEQQVGEFQDVLGYEFYTVDPDSGRARELSRLECDPELPRHEDEVPHPDRLVVGSALERAGRLVRADDVLLCHRNPFR